MAAQAGAQPLDLKSRFRAFRSSRTFITFVVAYAVFTEQFLFAVIVPVAPFSLQQRIDVSEERTQWWIVWLLASYGLAEVISSPFWGWWTDRRTSRKTPFLLGLIALLGATIMLWLARTKALLVLSRVLQGVGATVIWTTGLAILVDAVGEAHIGEYIGYISIALNISTLLAPMLGGVVFARAGSNAVFGMACGVVALDILLRFIIIESHAPVEDMSAAGRRPDTKKEDPESGCYLCVLEHGKQSGIIRFMTPDFSEDPFHGPSIKCDTPKRLKPGLLQRLRLPPVITMCFSLRCLAALWGGLIYATILAGFLTVLPLRLHDVFGWNSLGGLMFVPLVLPGLLGPFIGKLADVYGHRWFAAAGFMALCPALILLRLVDLDNIAQKVLLGVLLFVIGLGGTCLLEPLIAEITYLGGGGGQRKGSVEVVKVRSYAQAYALFNVAWALGDMIGPLVAGLMVDSAGWDSMTLTLGVLAGVSAITTGLWCGGWYFDD